MVEGFLLAILLMSLPIYFLFITYPIMQLDHPYYLAELRSNDSGCLQISNILSKNVYANNVFIK